MRSTFTARDLILPLVLAVGLWLLLPRWPLFDFTLFWKASENLVRGDNPYQLPPYSQFVDSDLEKIAPRGAALPALSSPIAFGLLGFVGNLTLDRAKDIFLFLMYFAFGWSCWIGYRMLAKEGETPGSGDLALLALALPLGLFYQAMTWGSMSVICVIGICGFITAIGAKRLFLAGCFLGLCFVKWHLFLPVVLYILWRSTTRRCVALPLGMASLVGASLAIALWLQPQILTMYLHVLRSDVPFTVITNASLGSILYSLSGRSSELWLLLPTAVVCLATAWFTRLEISENVELSVPCLLPWSLMLSPYSWGHDYTSCFPVPFIAALLLKKKALPGPFKLRKWLLAAFLASAGVTNLLSPTFKHQWMFIFCGVTLAAVSLVVVIHALHCQSTYIRSVSHE